VNDDAETRRIAPMILRALEIDARELRNVREEKAEVLPGFE
jgi:hypothetical protein